MASGTEYTFKWDSYLLLKTDLSATVLEGNDGGSNLIPRQDIICVKWQQENVL